MTNGKGDRPRPVDRRKYDANFDAIDWPSRREPEWVSDCCGAPPGIIEDLCSKCKEHCEFVVI